jgi:dienelactone hydrolase
MGRRFLAIGATADIELETAFPGVTSSLLHTCAVRPVLDDFLAFAETDQSVPAHIPGELKQALDKADAKHELKVFPGTHHGFCFPERAVYDTLAAEETWSKIFAMWDRCLK